MTTIDWSAIDSIERARTLVETSVPVGATREEIAAFLGSTGIGRAFEDEADGVIRAVVDGPTPQPSVQVRWLLTFHLGVDDTCTQIVVEESVLAP
ncbi:MAG: hypothetical protein OSA99_12860 [Acidimicrobiales bacterium]|nr:hypothetical protein [Acidimicrobiales bacterium]